MFNHLLSIATAKNVTRCLIITLLFMLVMNLGATKFYEFTHGVGILDTGGGTNLLDNHTTGYTPESAYEMLTAYGSQGIRYHLMLTMADVFFPPTLAFFFVLVITYYYAQVFKSRPITRGLVALPIIYLVSDYLENVGIATMLLNFPSKVPGMARLANTMFLIKNLTSNVIALVILIGLILWGRQRIRDLRIKKQPEAVPNADQ